MSFSVENKVALVTGANRGIGKVITETLLEHSASKVYAAVRKPQTAEPLIAEHGNRIEPVEMDLSRFETVSAAAEKATDVSLVINNAGVLRAASLLEEEAIEALHFELDVNLYGLIRVVHAFAPVLKANGGGAFVQLNSVASMKSFPDFATYCASKAASYSITQALRDKLGEQGTQVVSVHPGPIATDMAHSAGLGEMAESPSTVAEGIITALRSGIFHVFPDSMAGQIGEAYKGFAEGVVEANLMEA